MDETDTTGISLEATLPLAWVKAEQLSHANLELRTQTNIALLRSLAAIDVPPPEHDTHGEPIHKALERVEAKVDMTLLLVARLMGATMSLPTETQVTLSNQRITWLESGKPPAVGLQLVVDVYLNARIPQALHLPVAVIEVQKQENGVKVVADLQEVVTEFEEWLTRTIFRYHRRALQASKQV
jgi:Atypical PilZ domain, cyclic di-GMP receptor